MIFGKLICFFNGHKRGKLSGEASNFGMPGATRKDYKIFACPRCGRVKRYKVKSA